MKPRNETSRSAETFASNAMWLLLVGMGVLAGKDWRVTAVAGCLTLALAAALAGAFASRNLSGKVLSAVCGFARFLPAIAGAATLAFPTTRSTDLWVVAACLTALDAYVAQDLHRCAVFTGLVILAELASGQRMHDLSGVALMPALSTVGACLAGLGVAQAQAREARLRSRDNRLAAVLDCGSELATSSDLDSTLLQTLKSAVHETGASCGFVMLFDEVEKETLVTECAYGADGEFDFPERLQIGEGMSGYVAKLGQPVSVSRSGNEELDIAGVTPGALAAAGVPLVIRNQAGGGQAAVDQILGSLTLLNYKSQTAFGKEDMELLRSLASLMAVAVSHSRMEERRRTTFLLTLESLATALEARDEYTRGHSQRVCEVSLLIGEKMGFGPEAIEELRVGTILHDIGKIGVPDAILNKRARLTDEEFEVMKSHPVIGYEICKPLMLSAGVLMIIRNHHEKLDGSGYPDGLKGGELPLSLRIVCVADAFDAMSSARPYRNVMDTQTVLAELSKGAGTQFDPVVVELLKELMATDRLRELYKKYWGEGERLAA